MPIVIPIAVLSIVAVIAVKMYHDYKAASSNNVARWIAFAVSLVGMLGFVEAAWINLLPAEFVNHFELPNTLQGVRLTAPDGRVFIVSSPIGRVQRYGPGGFEKGFSYAHKAFEFGMTPSGNILICGIGGLLLTYDPDGVEVPPRRSCLHVDDRPVATYPGNAKVPAIAFNRFSALAVPLWHPVAGWLVAVFGGLIHMCFSRSKSDESGASA